MSEATRIVHCEDALTWLKAQPVLEGCSLVASLPDISEVSAATLEEWKRYFIDTASLIMSRCPDDGVSIFFQSDIKVQGTWVDKGYLCQKAADSLGHELLWHKIVCRAPAGIATHSKSGYSHLLCFSKKLRLLDSATSTADVLPDVGEKTWTRGTGLEASLAIARFIDSHTPSRTVVNPFCGQGSMLAAANAVGLNAIGIERSPKRAEKSRDLAIDLDQKTFIGL